MSVDRVARLLKDTMGLDVASVGRSVIEHAIRARQRARGVTDADVYWQLVQEPGTELQKLIEAVVVPETWFFRDADAFAALCGFVGEARLTSHADRVLRLLSLPCSTGEEPYSMAMAMLDAGWPAHRFRIDAIDISERVLSHGRRGVYQQNSFRTKDLSFRDRHFVKVDDGHQISDAVRRQVEFQQGNVFSPAFLPGAAIYDVIFCRNMLIYFDRPGQARVTSVLGRLLTPSGTLFVGAAETGVFLNTDFSSVKLSMAFAFQKTTSTSHAAKLDIFETLPARLGKRGTLKSTPARLPRPTPLIARSAVHPPTSLAVRQPSASGALEEARQFADQGRFVEAARCCEEHRRQFGPSADGFYLLGLVRDASGNHVEAAQYYKKAIYLNPDHGEALIHLALLLEDRGHSRDAQTLRNRIDRLEQRRKA